LGLSRKKCTLSKVISTDMLNAIAELAAPGRVCRRGGGRRGPEPTHGQPRHGKRRHGDAGQERDAPAGSREQSGRAPCMLVLCHETLPLPPPGGAAPRAILPVTLGPPPKPAATRGKSRGQHYAERARVWWRYGGRVRCLLGASAVHSF
jgi:hypothetical protein